MLHFIAAGRSPRSVGRTFTRAVVAPLSLLAALSAGMTGTAHAAADAPAEALAKLDVAQPVMQCADLKSADLANGGPIAGTVTSAEVSGGGDTGFCDVKGTVEGRIHFEARLPLQTYTQRFLMIGCGGYCGMVNIDNGGVDAAAKGCAPLTSNRVATVATDLGHKGDYPDGAWAKDNPTAVVDLAYSGMHATTVVVKNLVTKYYGKAPAKSYYSGCSDGGREGLHEAQRYPTDYDGMLVGAPVIDEVETNTFYHAWNVRVNSKPDGSPILTANKIPALVKAVTQACGDAGGLVQDPRACTFDPRTIACAKGQDDDTCLTQEQIAVVRKIWSGPVDEHGRHLTAGDMPIGGEAGWLGGMVPKHVGDPIGLKNSADKAFSWDFPNYMAQFGAPTGITNANMAFTSAEYTKLTKLDGLWNPTNPDLRAFIAHGGKLVIWHGWADTGASPFTTLNYVSKVKAFVGADAFDKFARLYMIPGVYHCNGGPSPATEDFLTPLMSWVETGTAPDKVVVNFVKSEKDDTVLKSRPVFPYPSTVRYAGGDINSADSYVRADVPAGVSDVYDFAGLKHYSPGNQMACSVDGDHVHCVNH
ncbi:tannase/feruloyl esterase family alpha/beta hydrolase [Pararobbsia silviterrae]|nr:tannase/feruloyl esterase family alpha/beta hydrolase [Pararobbsia silviterrae]